jgi:membrane-associated phospholipid phosphatase
VGLPLTALRAASKPHETSLRLTARGATFAAVLVLYIALTILVLVPSPVLTLDTTLKNLHLWYHHPQYHGFIDWYVLFGQRGPATLAFLPFFFWIAWRQRSTRPLVLLVTALVLLNVTVGVVKYATGRIGPLHSNDVHAIFAGGNIYPSGHVSNAVVLYGLVAWLVPRFRKLAIGAAVFLCITVGLCTVYLRTHWFSDVVGGWLAGSLVLLSLPTAMPYAERWTNRLLDWAKARYARWRSAPVPEVVANPAFATPTAVDGGAPAYAARCPGNATPVSFSARSQSRAAMTVSVDALDERTRVG